MVETKEILIDKIDFLENVRLELKDLAELMGSIKSYGLLQPIGVIKEEIRNEERFILVYGHRRLEACRKLGFKTITARVYDVDEAPKNNSEFLILNTIENIQRKNISTIELGRIINELKNEMSNSEIAVKLGIEKSKVRICMDEFKRVPEKYRTKVFSLLPKDFRDKKGMIGETSAGKITHLRGITKEEREKLWEMIKKEEISGYQLNIIGPLLREGLTFSEAIKKINDYNLINIKFLVHKSIYDEIIDENKQNKPFFKELLRKEFKLPRNNKLIY